jgi:DNA-directed RNA polymerase specialized sigma24 family protein
LPELAAAGAQNPFAPKHELRSMSANPKQNPSVTLMMRLQEDPADPRARDEFVRRYHPMIRAWCLRWESRPADADIVAQQVLVNLLTAMEQFRNQAGSGFRGWLKTVTRTAWLDFLASRQFSNPHWESINSLTTSNDAYGDLERQVQRF